ncbi:MAG: hypothetical protein JSV94_00535 [Methanobacteriota archaeon]|nr:MAG: hypothetical protein JSV94_00535 [Euryarchaeota archaeon]
MWTAFTETIRFIVVPIILVDMITENYPQLATAFMPNIETFIIFFGGMIVASSTIEAANRPGTYKRMLFGLFAIAFVGLWFFVVFGGGIAEINYGPYFVRFDITKIVYIVLFGVSLKGLLIVSTFKDHRDAELKRARKRRAEIADARAQGSRPLPTPQTRAARFASMMSQEFEVSADDGIGYAPSMPPRPIAKDKKLCEVCGAEAPVKDYVCRNCGEWFPSDTSV